MQLTLTDHDSEILREVLHDYLPALQREAARTEQREFRHLMIERQELVERLLEQLTPNPA